MQSLLAIHLEPASPHVGTDKNNFPCKAIWCLAEARGRETCYLGRGKDMSWRFSDFWKKEEVTKERREKEESRNSIAIRNPWPWSNAPSNKTCPGLWARMELEMRVVVWTWCLAEVWGRESWSLGLPKGMAGTLYLLGKEEQQQKIERGLKGSHKPEP